jgi:hypothetical protein
MKHKQKKEKVRQSALIHSSLGDFKISANGGEIRMKSGGHGEDNIKKLRNLGIGYNIVEQYPNGVRLGNIPTHVESRRRTGTFHTWFPKSWSRNKIKVAGEKTINSIPYEIPNGVVVFGNYRKVKVGVIKRKGRVVTIFPYFKQSGRSKKL